MGGGWSRGERSTSGQGQVQRKEREALGLGGRERGRETDEREVEIETGSKAWLPLQRSNRKEGEGIAGAFLLDGEGHIGHADRLCSDMVVIGPWAGQVSV